MHIKPHFIAALLCLITLHLRAQVCLPTLTLYNGLSVNIHPVDTDGDGLADQDGAIVRMSDLIAGASDPCGNGPLSFAIRASGTGASMPADTAISFTCDNLGTQLIEVWVRNASGQTNYALTYVIVQSNAPDGCMQPPHPLPAACTADVLAPEVFSVNGLGGVLQPDETGEPVLRVHVSDFVKTAYDNCNQVLQYRIQRSGWGAGPPNTTGLKFDCSDLGIQIVEIWAGDAAGNWNYSQTYVVVQDESGVCGTVQTPVLPGCLTDKTPPELLVYDGLAQTLSWSPDGPGLTANALDFIRLGADKCHKVTGWRITKASDGKPAPAPPYTATATVHFDCSELGTQPVYVWLQDGAGNWARAQSYIVVQDNLDLCGRSNDERAHVVIPEFKKEILRRLSGAAVEMNRRKAVGAVGNLSVWPNPASEAFSLSADLTEAGPLRVELYDCFGRLLQVLSNQPWCEAGTATVHFLRQQWPAGLYRCVVRFGDTVRTLPLVFQ